MIFLRPIVHHHLLKALLNAEAIRTASGNIQKVGEAFDQTDVMIGNEIGKN